MKFDEISGAQTLQVTTEKFNKVSKSINETLENNDAEKVENTQIANLAIAVGIKEKRQNQPESTSKALKMESLDQDRVLRTIIERRHKNSSPEKLKEHMQGYLEGGIEIMFEDIKKQNYFEYHRYVKDAEGSLNN
ncbi:hypothetical protein [Halorubrum sp. FL23]|uniref:hypothetical protein n=1 Tax=Halorubrum sp. FL23 TaxID=3458704 RepID=UPI004034F37D